MEKALIHDWYYVNGGAEKVIHCMNNIWDDLNHFSLVDFLDEKDRNFILKGRYATTSFIQKLPTSKTNHRKFLQLFPYAIEQFDLRNFDLILSSSACVAKGVLTNTNQLHICYCHSPVRYAWDLYQDYLEESGFNRGLKSMYVRYVLHKIRNWDISSVNRVDFFIANSHYIANRIKKIYDREAVVIYPPVDVESFNLEVNKEDFYFTASRMVPYKRIELIVEAFNKMPDKRLVVSGDGPEFKKIKKIAGPNINLLGYTETKVLKNYMQRAKAFVFAAEEDFGIIPVESQACGTPVIAFNKGGVRETVVEGKTGLFFDKQESDCIMDAVHRFETLQFNYSEIRDHVLKFSKERFEKEIYDFVSLKYKEFKMNQSLKVK